MYVLKKRCYLYTPGAKRHCLHTRTSKVGIVFVYLRLKLGLIYMLGALGCTSAAQPKKFGRSFASRLHLPQLLRRPSHDCVSELDYLCIYIYMRVCKYTSVETFVYAVCIYIYIHMHIIPCIHRYIFTFVCIRKSFCCHEVVLVCRSMAHHLQHLCSRG